MNGSKKKGAKGRAALAAVPAKAAAKSATTLDSAIDLETVRELARILEEFGLTEISADPSGSVRVSRAAHGVAGAASAAAAAPPPIALAPAPPVEGASEAGTFITSPFVGTFYSA